MTKETPTTFQRFAELCLQVYSRANDDFSQPEARDKFFRTAIAVLKGDKVRATRPADSVPRDSSPWAAYIAVRDYSGLGEVFDASVRERGLPSVQNRWDDDSDSSDSPWENPVGGQPTRPPVHPRMMDENGNPLVWDRSIGAYRPMKPHPNKGNSEKMKTLSEHGVRMRLNGADESSSEDSSDKESEPAAVSFMERRAKGSKPHLVPIPKIPSYDKENEYIRAHIKSSDMLYSYVVQKAGGGVRLSAGLRKYFESNDFWEFAFDTLCAGGWCDSATNRPIANISKYLTKVIIEEYVAHEATKHSRFENKFKNAAELAEWIHFNYHGERKDEISKPEFCAWFLNTMNDCGWRDFKGRPINSIPMELTKQYEKYLAWSRENKDMTVGLNPDQYEHLLNAQRAKSEGKIKPGADGKYSWQDLQKAMLGKI